MGYNHYNLLINGVYWGYNPFTNHLLTSWDIQVGDAVRFRKKLLGFGSLFFTWRDLVCPIDFLLGFFGKLCSFKKTRDWWCESCFWSKNFRDPEKNRQKNCINFSRIWVDFGRSLILSKTHPKSSIYRPFLPKSWKWKTAHLETKHIFQDPTFHGTMIMGGRAMWYSSRNRLEEALTTTKRLRGWWNLECRFFFHT